MHEVIVIYVPSICGFYFRGSKSVSENHENLHPAKISLYMVLYKMECNEST